MQSQHIRNKASFFFHIGKTKYIKKIHPPAYNFSIDIIYYIHIVYEFIYSYSLSQHQHLLFQLKFIVLLLNPWNIENTGCRHLRKTGMLFSASLFPPLDYFSFPSLLPNLFVVYPVLSHGPFSVLPQHTAIQQSEL